MPLRVRLLGRPGLEHDGESRRLEGYKPWALLTYLLLEPRAPTRRELADLLWSEADDPLGAVRWSLSQVRKAVNPPAEIGERDGRIKIDAEVLVVDAGELLRGEWDESSIDDLVRGELLEGMSFGEAPSFDTWLQVQRARVATAAADALRWAATLLSHREPDRALALAERALRSEPFDDGLHELVVEIHTARGDRDRPQGGDEGACPEDGYQSWVPQAEQVPCGGPPGAGDISSLHTGHDAVAWWDTSCHTPEIRRSRVGPPDGAVSTGRSSLSATSVVTRPSASRRRHGRGRGPRASGSAPSPGSRAAGARGRPP